MGRRSYGGRPVRAPARTPARSTPAPARSPPAPAPAKTAPPPAPVQNSGPGFGSMIAEGMAFGTGSAIAHRAADAVLGPRTIKHETVPAAGPETAAATTSSYSDACGMHYKAFQDCINSSGSDISKCQFYMDMLSECRKGSGLAA